MARKHANTSFIDSTPFDALFGGIDNAPSREEIEIIESSDGVETELPLEKLVEERNHSFKVLNDESMERLVDSIKTNGIYYPLLVRPSGDNYEILSGHRRLFAAKTLGMETVPCKILDVDDPTADIIMVDTNLHREEILPSEKARSYDIRIKAMQAKGLLDVEGERRYEELLAYNVNSSRVNVYRYRKLLLLLPEILDMVDEKKIAVNAAAKIAALPHSGQQAILEALQSTDKLLSMKAADKLAAEKNLTKEKALQIIENKRPVTKSASIRERNLYSVYPEAIKTLPPNDKEAFIKDCIKAYIKSHDSWKGTKLK